MWLLAGLLLQFALVVYLSKKYKGKPGAITPIYSPPAGLTAPEVGYIDQKLYSNGLFAAAIVEAAQEKYITLTVTKGSLDNSYSLKKSRHTTGPVNSFSQAIADQCPLDIVPRVYSPEVAALNKQLEANLTASNTAVTQLKWPKPVSLVLTLALVFMCFVCMYTFYSYIFWLSFLLIFVTIVLHASVTVSSGSYSPEGKELENQILGFKRFLSATDLERRTFPNAPELTPELYEKYLPYAIALNIENAWGTLFKDTLANATTDKNHTPSINYVGWGNSRSYYSHRGGLFRLGMAAGLLSVSSPPSVSTGGSSGTDYSSGGSSFGGDSYDSSSDSSGGSSDDGGGGGGGDGF